MEDGARRYRSRDGGLFVVTGPEPTAITVEYSVPKVFLYMSTPIRPGTVTELAQVAATVNGYDVTLMSAEGTNQTEVQAGAEAALAEVRDTWYDLVIWFSSGFVPAAETEVLGAYLAGGGRIMYTAYVGTGQSDLYELLGARPLSHAETPSVTFPAGFLTGEDVDSLTLAYAGAYVQLLRPLVNIESLCHLPGSSEYSCAVEANDGRSLMFGVHSYLFTDGADYPWIYSNALEYLLGYPQ